VRERKGGGKDLTRGSRRSAREVVGSGCQRPRERGSRRAAQEELGRRETGPSAGAGEEEGGGNLVGPLKWREMFPLFLFCFLLYKSHFKLISKSFLNLFEMF
jgi:hypothetical protein